ncbi:hypothetical protein B0H14DRAFT_2373211 [Mycena olivaceomarginata]|nr:hypothetical protein B0H14DRAFT_2373211 [Mycena olivaceomarginata]
MSVSIIFYDIPSTHPSRTWSPNLWKTRLLNQKSRYALNFKRVPYKTVWLEYPEIEGRCKEIGAPPSGVKPDGRPHFTLPVIQDLSTGAVISDSSKIAAYLDATYPDRPRLMPPGTTGLHRAFEDAARTQLDPISRYGPPASHKNLNPLSAEYFRRTREATWGKTLEELTPKGEEDAVEWKKLEDGFGKLDEWIRANGEGSSYFMGDALTYADIFLAAYVHWIRLVLPEKWDEIKLWHQGRWAKLLKGLGDYETVF